MPGVIKYATTELTNALSGNAGLISLLNTPNETSGSNQAPKAYLNILFFDERFKFDEAASRVIPIGYNLELKVL